MPSTVRYDRLPTEAAHPRTTDLDRLTPEQLVRAMNREDNAAVRAVERSAKNIGRAIRLIAACLRDGGRLFFVGAGTSGRLGVIEAAECPPTFSTPPSLVQALIAGGRGAVFRSKEGAEDDGAAGCNAVQRTAHAGDAVVGITASGVTPFVDEALRCASTLGAATVLVACSGRSPIPADIRILLATGPEVLAGSTRLKAGTATKLALNRITLGVMTQLGKTHGNLMVDVRPTSRKLRERALRLVQTLAGADRPAAERALGASGGSVKLAVVMLRQGLDAVPARRLLARSQSSLRAALEKG